MVKKFYKRDFSYVLLDTNNGLGSPFHRSRYQYLGAFDDPRRFFKFKDFISHQVKKRRKSYQLRAQTIFSNKIDSMGFVKRHNENEGVTHKYGYGS